VGSTPIGGTWSEGADLYFIYKIMYKCKFCNKEYKSVYERSNIRNLKKHLLYCVLNPDKILYKCKYCSEEKDSGTKLGAHVSNCKYNPNYYAILKSKKEKGREGRPHSEESKDKIRNGRIRYLLNNPDKVPYKLNHSSKESYPEKYFTELFKKENIKVEKSFRVGLYELDFCIPDKKIDIEIDGEQHYVDKRIKDSDIRRTNFLKENGWLVFRIRWSNYKKMTYEDKVIIINELKEIISKTDFRN
jgi:very-short-patch-repair endonuclease